MAEAGRLSRLLEDAQARRARLAMELAAAQQALAAAESDRQGALAAQESASAAERDLAGHRAQLLGRLAVAHDEVRRADSALAAVATIGRTTPVARPPAKGQSPADQRAQAERAASDAQARTAELTGLLDRTGAELQVAGERVRSAAARVEALGEQIRVAQEAVASLGQKMAGVAENLTGSLALLDALAVGTAPSALALADIPADMLALYPRAAASCPGLPWSVLAAVGSVETSHGRVDLPGVRSGANFAGAMGPMQFLEPTWAAYGVDGDGDGRRDVYHAVDAVFGAANYLCASGASRPAGLPSAIWAYNHADWYVDAVLEVAAGYGAAGLVATETAASALVALPNLTLSPQARDDILAGVVDSRLVALLAAASAKHAITVSVIRSGHSQFVSGTDRVSNHYHGRGVDIAAVDGAAVSAANDAALELALSILASGPPLRPDELGSPWTSLTEFAGAFTDDDHADHLHLGWREKAPEFHQVKDSGQ